MSISKACGATAPFYCRSIGGVDRLGYNSGMNTQDRSHRRAVWLIVALVLAFVAGLVGYELNWIHQRRTFLAEQESASESEWDRAAEPFTGSSGEWELPPMSPTRGPPPLSITELPPLGSTVPQRLLQWLGEPDFGGSMVLYCLVDGDRTLAMLIAVDEIPKVSRARRLFPEAGVIVMLFARGGRGPTSVRPPGVSAR